jgi:UDP-N-acetylmuramate--alanine ligase
VHLIGGAGAGMQALAAVFRQAGCELSGSDAVGFPSGQTESASKFRVGHAADQLPRDCELVVYSPAIEATNPELVRARELKIPALSYPQTLGRMMASRRGVAISGTHGKSTTTAMAASILHAAGLDSTVVYGATACQPSQGARYGRGDWLLAEACEYRQHFCHLRPELAVVLGVEWDHVDCFPTLAEARAAFARFVLGVDDAGKLLVSDACENSISIAISSGRRFETFGIGGNSDWRASELLAERGNYSFTIEYRGRSLTRTRLTVPGRHNVLNAVAAAAVAWNCGAREAEIGRGLRDFAGLRRRLEPFGDYRGVTLVDDYAHHPTEVAASLSSLRECYPGRRLWCVFQPHQASRTAAFLDEFAQSLQNADRVLVADVFLARERSASRFDLAEALASRVPSGVAATSREIIALLRRDLCPGDVLVTMGAGDIGNIAHGIIDRF